MHLDLIIILLLSSQATECDQIRFGLVFVLVCKTKSLLWLFFNWGLHLGYLHWHPWEMRCFLAVISSKEVPASSSMDLSTSDMTLGLYFYLSILIPYEQCPQLSSKPLKLVYSVTANHLLFNEWLVWICKNALIILHILCLFSAKHLWCFHMVFGHCCHQSIRNRLKDIHCWFQHLFWRVRFKNDD